MNLLEITVGSKVIADFDSSPYGLDYIVVQKKELATSGYDKPYFIVMQVNLDGRVHLQLEGKYKGRLLSNCFSADQLTAYI